MTETEANPPVATKLAVEATANKDTLPTTTEVPAAGHTANEVQQSGENGQCASEKHASGQEPAGQHATAQDATAQEVADTPAEQPKPVEDDDANNNEEQPPKEEDSAPAAEEEDDKWYGEGPPEAIANMVQEELGEKVTTVFTKAYKQLNGAADNVQRVLAATATFVTALKHVPEDLQTTGAFGELSLAYGKSLVRYVELEGSGTAAIVSKMMKAVREFAASGRADGDGADPDGEAAGDDDEDDAEDDTGKDGDEEEDMEAAWTQLEVARVIFSRMGWKEREAECRATLGDLLVACDEGKQAACEFESASNLFTDARRKAECLYKRYLALRNGDRVGATASLKEAVSIYEGVEGSNDVLADMRTELKDIIAAMAESGQDSAAGTDEGKAKEIEVVSVRPKRKRDVLAEQKGDEAAKEGAVDGADATTAKPLNGGATDETNGNGKKARIEELTEAPAEKI